MDEAEMGGMEVHPRLAAGALRRVERVAEDGVAEGQQMHAELMGAAGDGMQFDPADRFRIGAVAFEHPVTGQRAAAPRQVDDLARAMLANAHHAVNLDEDIEGEVAL